MLKEVAAGAFLVLVIWGLLAFLDIVVRGVLP
jgi:hypothetical protein